MLVIRKIQIQALSNAMNDVFKQRMFEDLIAYSEKSNITTPQEPSSFIDEGFSLAKTYRIIYEDDIKRFLKIMLLLRMKFDKGHLDPKIHPILTSSNLDGNTKLSLIEELIIETDSAEDVEN